MAPQTILLLKYYVGKTMASFIFVFCSCLLVLSPTHWTPPKHISCILVTDVAIGISVDWWALGVLLFEMLAGRSPFDVASGHEMPDQSTEDYLFQGNYIVIAFIYGIF